MISWVMIVSFLFVFFIFSMFIKVFEDNNNRDNRLFIFRIYFLGDVVKYGINLIVLEI